MQPHSSTHCCYVCTGCRYDSNGNKSAKEGRWRKGEYRTLGFNSQQYQNWKDATASATSPQEARSKLSDFFNCHVEPLNLNPDRQKRTILFMPFDPLHVNKVSNFFL